MTAKEVKNYWSRRQWFVITTTTISTFGCAIIVSLQAPFFPKEASIKNVRPSIYGFVFGAYSLTVFILAPIFGKYIEFIRPRFMLNSGLFLVSCCCILFGTLDKIQSRTAFITLAFLIRIVEATGAAGFITASFSVVAQTFPGEIGKTFAGLRAAFGIGLTIGPTIGGSLYEIGGFILPFVSTGTILLLITFVVILIFWNENDEQLPTEISQSICTAIRIPTVFLCMASTLVAAISIGFVEATLEPNLRQFNVSSITVGFVFLTTAAVEAITYAFCAWVSNGKQIHKPICIIGLAALVITYLLIGPAPFFPVESSLWLVIVAMAFHGLGLGAVFQSSHVEALQSSIANGFSNSFQTCGLISGIWASSLELGHFLGPSLGGILYDLFQFRMASVVPLAFETFMMVVMTSYFLIVDLPKLKRIQ